MAEKDFIRNLLLSTEPSDEAYYEYVDEEMARGQIRRGLWLKSLAEAEGDVTKAKARYIICRVGELKVSSPRIGGLARQIKELEQRLTLLEQRREDLQQKLPLVRRDAEHSKVRIGPVQEELSRVVPIKSLRLRTQVVSAGVTGVALSLIALAVTQGAIPAIIAIPIGMLVGLVSATVVIDRKPAHRTALREAQRLRDLLINLHAEWSVADYEAQRLENQIENLSSEAVEVKGQLTLAYDEYHSILGQTESGQAKEVPAPANFSAVAEGPDPAPNAPSTGPSTAGEKIHMENLKRLTIDAHLEHLESKIRRALSKVGIQVQPLRADRRKWVFLILTLMLIGIALSSPYILYRYDEANHMVLRTNRLTSAKAVRFKAKEANAAIIAGITREMGLPVEKVNVSRDGGSWIAMEDYATFVERRRTRMELERTREELEAMRADVQRREQDQRWQEISKESDARLKELQRESERQSQEMRQRSREMLEQFQMKMLEDEIQRLSRERR